MASQSYIGQHIMAKVLNFVKQLWQRLQNSVTKPWEHICTHILHSNSYSGQSR